MCLCAVLWGPLCQGFWEWCNKQFQDAANRSEKLCGKISNPKNCCSLSLSVHILSVMDSLTCSSQGR